MVSNTATTEGNPLAMDISPVDQVQPQEVLTPATSTSPVEVLVTTASQLILVGTNVTAQAPITGLGNILPTLLLLHSADLQH